MKRAPGSCSENERRVAKVKIITLAIRRSERRVADVKVFTPATLLSSFTPATRHSFSQYLPGVRVSPSLPCGQFHCSYPLLIFTLTTRYSHSPSIPGAQSSTALTLLSLASLFSLHLPGVHTITVATCYSLLL